MSRIHVCANLLHVNLLHGQYLIQKMMCSKQSHGSNYGSGSKTLSALLTACPFTETTRLARQPMYTASHNWGCI